MISFSNYPRQERWMENDLDIQEGRAGSTGGSYSGISAPIPVYVAAFPHGKHPSSAPTRHPSGVPHNKTVTSDLLLE